MLRASLLLPIIALSGSAAFAQVVHIQDTAGSATQARLQPLADLPQATLEAVPEGRVVLTPGLFHTRRELTKDYILRLKNEDLLQNHYLEAGIRIDKPSDQMHQGWEAPQSQLRGHFVGHWLSAAARFAANDHDPLLAARAAEVVQGLKHCQELNGGEWVGSIPEKYFKILEDDEEWIWSPQYTLHKTLMGLFDDYKYLHDPEALEVEKRGADWFLDWTAKVIRDGKAQTIYDGESGGLLEVWADLYSATKDGKYLMLASRYAHPEMFAQVLAGEDPLTDKHTNASIPWFQGAARLYEVTGDPRYRRIVEAFWKSAVEDRGMFATTGANAGEFWIPPGQFGRFLGRQTQEHCTVYNMIRIAQYLYRWTGDAKYADYIERALYNGILAQQNPSTGMVSYFLPLAPGAKKSWSTETHDFWCCLGTLLQAQAMYESLIYYRTADGVTVSQYIPSTATLGPAGHAIHVELSLGDEADRANFVAAGDASRFDVDLSVTADTDDEWTLRIRQPAWALEPGTVTVDGHPVAAPVNHGYLEMRRNWRSAKVRVSFFKHLVREPLPGDPTHFAFVDGPIVLAALTAEEPQVAPRAAIIPQYQHEYVDGRDWRRSHYWVPTSQGRVEVEPLFDISDETYTVYFSTVH